MATPTRTRTGLGLLLVSALNVLAGCATRDAKPTTVVLDSGATIPPQVVRQARIEIPSELTTRSCASGTTVIEVQVGATGRVQGARVRVPSHEPTFDAACVRSAQTSEYRPATSHGTPTTGVTKIECKLACP